jgi:hypothetical protein
MRPIYSFPILLLVATVAAGIAWAQPNKIHISTTEEVVIAFYKTAGAPPPYESWIKETEPYRVTAVARRPATMAQEKARLKSIYESFNPAKDLLTIRTTVIARAAQYQDPNDKDKTISVLEMRFEAGDADYFPYDFLDERFAVIPQDIAKHLKPTVMNEQFAYLNEQLDRGKPVTLILELRPIKADTEGPFNLDGTGGGVDADDGKGQWMFLTDIASMSVWNKTGSLLWEYTAPWYITPMRQNLLELKQSAPDPLEQMPPQLAPAQ